MDGFPNPSVQAWLDRRTFYGCERSLDDLMQLKADGELSVGVCLPALNEAGTIGDICRAIGSALVTPGFVDQLVVMDSGSTDETGAVAAEAGATVLVSSEVLSQAGTLEAPGKGESLWKSLAVMTTDIVVWLDSDTRNFGSHFVTALVEPLLAHDDLVFTKAFYDRPIDSGDEVLPMGGARVTEIAVRPLINLLCPNLVGFIQPLSGEFAGRHDALSAIPFGTGYDVDLLMLFELVEKFGLDRLAQVDLGSRVHRNRDIPSLGRMSFEIVRTLLDRLDQTGRLKLAEHLPDTLIQFSDSSGSRKLDEFVSRSTLRPPMATVIGS